MTEAEELELLELENENAGATSGGQAGGMGDVKMAESQAGKPQPYKDPNLSGGFGQSNTQAAAMVPRFIGDAAQSISTGLANAAIQGVQDNWGHPLDAVGGVIKNEVKNLASPFYTFENPIQSSSESLQRMGVPNTPMDPRNLPYGQFAPGGDAPIMGLADQAGVAADVLAPPFAGIAAIKAAGAASRESLKLLAAGKSSIAKSLQPAAEKAILGNYRKQLRAEFLPDNPTPGTIENFPRELSKTLKENDLLRPPEQAKINLNTGLEKYGKAIGETIKKATDADVSVNVQDVINNFASDTRSALTKTGKGAGEIKGIEDKILPQIQDIINNLGPDELGNIPLDKGVEFRRSLQAMVKNWDADSRPMVQSVAKDLSKRMNKKIEASHPVYGPRLARLNDRYSSLMDAEPMVTEAYKRAGGLESGPMINDRGLPMTKEGILTQAAKSIFSPREALMRVMPRTAERIANDAYLPPGSMSPLPEYVPPAPTVSPEDVRALRQPFGQDAPVGPGYLPPRTPQGRPAIAKAPDYLPAQPREGLPPRMPTNTRRSFEEKPATYIEGDSPNGMEIQPFEKSLPPRVPKGDPKSNGFPDNRESPAVAKVLNEAGRRPIVPNEARIERLKEALKKAKTKEAREKLQALLREENYRFKKESK